MTTLAITMMVVTQVAVTLITIYFFRKVLTTPNKSDN